MNIIEKSVLLTTPNGVMRTVLLIPKEEGKYPCLILYSEIFQLTGPIMRSAAIMAGHGFIVALPEVYFQHLEQGRVLGYDDAGKDIGNQLKIDTPLANYDDGVDAIVAYMKTLDNCSGRFGSIGFCLGGHLAFRAALNKSIEASACFYATDIHSGTLGKKGACDTFERINEIKGEVMMLWGRQDPHVPVEGRAKIYNELTAKKINFTWHEFNASHAFMRDEGERYDPSLALNCYNLAVGLFKKVLLR
ncbi:MAG TPA: dienelactone hydrolase family protein [Cytophagaceae bacterium]|jgi:carboxymethylenebutenolidase|nr:dienelactone hydrolase family protein [Cytophagaceae bacterium]